MNGIDPTSLPILAPAPPGVNRWDDGVPNKVERIRENYRGSSMLASWGTRWTWRTHGHRAWVDILEAAFTFEELVRIWVAMRCSGPLHAHIQDAHPYIDKAWGSLWRFGGMYILAEQDGGAYTTLVAVVQGLRALSWPGFDLRLGRSSRYGSQGYAQDIPRDEPRIYLDGDFGLFVYNQGKHVLTVGFSIGREGVYVAQIQLREKRGNRWLFKLNKHYVDAALEVLAQAFPDRPLWLVEGQSAVNAIVHSFGQDGCALMADAEESARIAAIYDRDLSAYVRFSDVTGYEGREYVKLLPRSTKEVAA